MNLPELDLPGTRQREAETKAKHTRNAMR